MSSAFYDQSKSLFSRQLRAYLATRGRAETGVLIEAALSAISDHLRNTQGQKVAYDVLTRHADAVLTPGLPASDPSELRNRI